MLKKQWRHASNDALACAVAASATVGSSSEVSGPPRGVIGPDPRASVHGLDEVSSGVTGFANGAR